MKAFGKIATGAFLAALFSLSFQGGNPITELAARNVSSLSGGNSLSVATAECKDLSTNACTITYENGDVKNSTGQPYIEY